MKDDLFDELLTSVREGGRILRGEAKASRTFAFPAPDVKGIREKLGLSQIQFATLLHISVRRLKTWEHGRRMPDGPAKLLLQIAATHPEVITKIINPVVRDTIKRRGRRLAKAKMQ